MKTAKRTITGMMMAAVLTAVVFAASSAWAGNLTPPGAPGATMKTLDQVEPRIPVVSAPVTLSAPGSYYLTGNLSGTVTISADNVTLDLMGYAIDGPTSGDAINIPSDQDNLVIRNGILTGTGTGIDARYLRDSNSRFENLTVSDCTYCGLYIGSDCRVENVMVRNCGNYGIQSSSAGKLEIRNCRVIGTTGDGIEADDGSVIVGNTIENGAGIGLQLDGTGSYIADNIIRGNADNYDLVDGNQLNLLLCEIPETLDWPCSVKLAGTLSTSQTAVNGITVAANDITIDMAGHTLVGPGASSENGIYQANTYRNLRIFNGKVVEWRGGAKRGIYAKGTSSILSDLQASTNYYGIYAGDGSTISDCAAHDNRAIGIYAGDGSTISDCAAYNNGDSGILTGDGSTISDCAATDNGGDGILAGLCSTIFDCTAYTNTSIGIYAGSGSTISDCAAQYNTSDGIQVFADSRVVGCVCDNNGNGAGDGAGIHAASPDNRIEGNTCTDNDRGIDVDTSGNFIVKNTCSGNTVNWDIAANNKVGVIVSAPNSGAISGSTGGSGVGSTDPWANFTY